MHFPYYVDVEPLTRCNLRCPMCFGPVPNSNEIIQSPEFFFRLWVELRSRGVKGIVISGGEPTLYSYRQAKDSIRTLEDIVTSAKQCDLSVVVSTNGINTAKTLSLVLNLDWLALPLDGVKQETQKFLRTTQKGIDYYQKLIDDSKALNPELRIKLGTVATAYNFNEVSLIGEEIIGRNLNIDTWKIYQYTPRRTAKIRDPTNKLGLQDSEFDALSGRLLSMQKFANFRIYPSSTSQRAGAYLFIYADGTVAIPNIGEDSVDYIIGKVAMYDFSALDQVPCFFTQLAAQGLIRPGSNACNYDHTYSGGNSAYSFNK